VDRALSLGWVGETVKGSATQGLVGRRQKLWPVVVAGGCRREVVGLAQEDPPLEMGVVVAPALQMPGWAW